VKRQKFSTKPNSGGGKGEKGKIKQGGAAKKTQEEIGGTGEYEAGAPSGVRGKGAKKPDPVPKAIKEGGWGLSAGRG